MKEQPQISMLGERSILLQWSWDFSEENLYWLLEVRRFIENKLIKSKVEIINAYNSILVVYASTINVVYDDFIVLKSTDFSTIKNEEAKSRLYNIPVCYDAHFALDIDFLSEQNKLSKREIINLHTAPEYILYFMGFLPGFLYLGGMHKKLSVPRKNEPRLKIEKGAVGIAENQTGIYPKSSPGGWQIIGNCPLNFFDPNAENPSPFSAGDRIKFYEVDKEEYDEISELVKSGKHTLKSEIK
tara:strand:+ start:46 stop:771 length:726 start_codon:yes stop_codon:yes gene_type:complete